MSEEAILIIVIIVVNILSFYIGFQVARRMFLRSLQDALVKAYTLGYKEGVSTCTEHFKRALSSQESED